MKCLPVPVKFLNNFHAYKINAAVHEIKRKMIADS